MHEATTLATIGEVTMTRVAMIVAYDMIQGTNLDGTALVIR